MKIYKWLGDIQNNEDLCECVCVKHQRRHVTHSHPNTNTFTYF